MMTSVAQLLQEIFFLALFATLPLLQNFRCSLTPSLLLTILVTVRATNKVNSFPFLSLLSSPLLPDSLFSAGEVNLVVSYGGQQAEGQSDVLAGSAYSLLLFGAGNVSFVFHPYYTPGSLPTTPAPTTSHNGTTSPPKPHQHHKGWIIVVAVVVPVVVVVATVVVIVCVCCHRRRSVYQQLTR